MDWPRQTKIHAYSKKWQKFHVFACFRYGLIIDYDSNTDELDINEVKDAGGRKYTKDELVFLKSSILKRRME